MRAQEFVVEYKTEEYRGLRFATDIKNGQLIVRALDDWGTNELGHVVFNIGDDDQLDPQDLEVDDRYQGQGIASTMYDYVKTLGYEIHRSWDQTPAGAGFWNKHRGAEERVWEVTNPDIHHPGFKHSQEIGDFLYTAKADNDTGWGTQLIITVYDGKKEIAQTEFIMDEETDSLESANTWVLPDYQELGIASTMYAYAKMLGNDIVPSRIQTDQGSAMWRSWNQKKQSKHILPRGHKGYNEIAEQQLTEAASAVLYHYTNTAAAAKILTSGEFLLASSTGTQAEQGYAIPGYPYFLSTTRSRVGDYHNRYVGNSAVMFVLNGSWLNHNYKTRPIDYWDRSWLHSGGTRSRESEDRVYSRTPEIPANNKSILEVHVLIVEQQENRSPEVRTILLSAKKQGIPAYLYTDEAAWKLQDKRKAVSPAQAADLLRGQQPSRKLYQRRNYLEDWLELIYKKNKSELTPSAAKKLRSLIVYGQGYRNEDDGLGVDLSNARKPGNEDYASAAKINQFMQKNKIATTVDLKNFLVDKWKDLY